MTYHARLFGLMALGLAVGGAGRARADLSIRGDFEGLSDPDLAGYRLTDGGPFTLLPPTPFVAGFTYSDDGTTTTFSAYISAPPVSTFPNSWDTTARGTISISDADRARGGYADLIDQMISIGADNVVTLNVSPGGIWKVNEAFELVGTVGLRPDGTPDPSSVSLRAFSGGEFAYVGGPLTTVVPEPSNFALAAIAVLMGVGYAWCRRREG